MRKYYLFETMARKNVTEDMLKARGISQATLNKFKQGSLVSMRTIAALCKILECRVEDIVEYIPEDME